MSQLLAWCRSEEELFQGGNQRQEQGRAGNVHNVDSGETAGMPKEQKPPSSSPVEHHDDKRAGETLGTWAASL